MYWNVMVKVFCPEAKEMVWANGTTPKKGGARCTKCGKCDHVKVNK